jgi:hypothetical protein
MNIDDELRQAGDRLNAKLEEVTVPQVRQRGTRIGRTLAVAAAVTIMIGGSVLWLTRGGDDGPVVAATSTSTTIDGAQPGPADEPQPAGPVVVIAEGTFVGADEPWRLSAFISEEDDLCMRLRGMTCGPVPNVSNPLSAPSGTTSEDPSEPRLSCAYGAIHATVVEVILTLSDGSIVKPPIRGGGDIPSNFYAYCWAGALNYASITAVDANGDTLAESTLTAPSSTTTTTGEELPAAATVWSISYPPTWHRADSELMPNLAMNSLTLATFPLRAGGSKCAQMPENALRDLSPGDALVSIFLNARPGTGAPLWPEDGFNDTVFPESTATTDAHECADRPDLEVHWGLWSLNGNGHYVLVVFGPNVADDRRAQTWEILSSLRTGESATLSNGRLCVVTRPPQPGLAPPAPYQPSPSDESMVWYGTTALWTPLTIDATYRPRKSVWWSSAFGGGAHEPTPEISVTYQRLDAKAPLISSGSPGTNAFTEEDGWFMIADIDPETRGCWKVTATYREATLSYVAYIP